MMRAGRLCSECSSSTKLNCKWTVSEFSSESGIITSPAFLSDDKSLKLQVKVHPRVVSCFVNISCNALKDRKQFHWKISLSFCDLRGQIIDVFEVENCKTRNNPCCFGEWKFIERDDLLEGLSDDTLVVHMDISYWATFSRKDPITENYSEIDPFALLPIWDRLLKDSKFKDFVISVRGIDLLVHRAVLATDSPVFAAMFDHDTLEKKTDRLEMDDVDPEVAELFLHFMYCGTTDLLDVDSALDLLKLADKYDMEHLKSYCADFIVSNLDENNIAQVLVSADMFNAGKLKSYAIEYFCKNKSVFDFEKFKPVLEERPSVLTEIGKKLPQLSSRFFSLYGIGMDYFP